MGRNLNSSASFPSLLTWHLHPFCLAGHSALWSLGAEIHARQMGSVRWPSTKSSIACDRGRTENSVEGV